MFLKTFDESGQEVIFYSREDFIEGLREYIENDKEAGDFRSFINLHSDDLINIFYNSGSNNVSSNLSKDIIEKLKYNPGKFAANLCGLIDNSIFTQKNQSEKIISTICKLETSKLIFKTCVNYALYVFFIHVAAYKIIKSPSLIRFQIKNVSFYCTKNIYKNSDNEIVLEFNLNKQTEAVRSNRENIKVFISPINFSEWYLSNKNSSKLDSKVLLDCEASCDSKVIIKRAIDSKTLSKPETENIHCEIKRGSPLARQLVAEPRYVKELNINFFIKLFKELSMYLNDQAKKYEAETNAMHLRRQDLFKDEEERARKKFDKKWGR